MKFYKFMHGMTWAAVASNGFAAGVFVYLFWLLTFDMPDPDGGGRAWYDIAFPYLFLIGGVFFCWKTWGAFKEARDYKKSSEYAELLRNAQPRTPFVPKTYDPSVETETYIREKLGALVKHGVITEAEINRADLDEALRIDAWEADIYGATSVLMELDDTLPGGFERLYTRTEQVEVFEEDYVALIGKFAAMLHVDTPENIRIDYGVKTSTLHFDWDGQSFSFTGDFPSKYLSWDVIPDLARLLETKADGRRIVSSATDMRFVVTGLTLDEMDALNADFVDTSMDGFEQFQPIS
jgi:hypothetical protein